MARKEALTGVPPESATRGLISVLKDHSILLRAVLWEAGML